METVNGFSVTEEMNEDSADESSSPRVTARPDSSRCAWTRRSLQRWTGGPRTTKRAGQTSSARRSARASRAHPQWAFKDGGAEGMTPRAMD